MKRYALKGINDDQHECAVCGRVELRRVMWLVELDGDGNELGLPFHCGTSCGAKLLGYTQSKVNTTVKNYSSLVYEFHEKLRRNHPLTAEYDRVRDQQLALVRQAGSWVIAHKTDEYQAHTQTLLILRQQLDQWIAAQPILIHI
jgi:hypothetical protein